MLSKVDTRSPGSPRFLFVVCQAGAEDALKAEIARRWPDFRLAFSRPGFVTFKVDTPHEPGERFELQATFARTYGFSLGKIVGDNADQMAQQLWQRLDTTDFDQLHVWQRDRRVPGDRGFEPGSSPLAEAVGERIAAHSPTPDRLHVNQLARRGQRVLDCVLVEPTEWWYGFHSATALVSRWPGGVPPLSAAGKISRAYLKLREALAWSQLPIEPADRCAEIGCAPGGATQALLEQGLHVTGIDPAEVDPSLEQHPHFVHIRKRAADVKRREFRKMKWLFADSNVAPRHTLDSVEAIVTHRDVHVRGLVLMLKLLEWKLADERPGYVQRVRGWGFRYTKTRQLAFNRQEICLVAMRNRGQRRKLGQRPTPATDGPE